MALSMVFGPIEGRSMRRSCPCFGRLHEHAAHWHANSAACAHFGKTREHLVGAFGGFHRQTCLPATTTACPTSNGPVACRQSNPMAISSRSRGDACTRPSAPSGTRIRGATSCAPDQVKAVLFEDLADPGQQVIVAAAKGRERPAARAHPRNRDAPATSDGRTSDPIKTTSRHPPARASRQNPADLADIDPVMRIPCDHGRVGGTTQREQYHSAARARGTDCAIANGTLPPPQMIASGPFRPRPERHAHRPPHSPRLRHRQRPLTVADEIDHLRHQRMRRRSAASVSTRSRNAPSPRNSVR